ncbi:MAG: DoxX family protein [Halobacteriaceae archaeon]
MTEELQSTVLGRTSSLDLSGKLTGYWVAFLRLLTGWWFLHAGLHKYYTAEPFTAGWFLSQTGTIVSPVLNAFAGGGTETFVNYMIPLGEVLIGLGLIVGCLTRLAAFFGATLMFFFYFANEDWSHGFVNGDLMGLVLFITVIVFGAGRVWGIDEYLEDTAIVQSNQWLRYVLG